MHGQPNLKINEECWTLIKISNINIRIENISQIHTMWNKWTENSKLQWTKFSRSSSASYWFLSLFLSLSLSLTFYCSRRIRDCKEKDFVQPVSAANIFNPFIFFSWLHVDFPVLINVSFQNLEMSLDYECLLLRFLSLHFLPLHTWRIWIIYTFDVSALWLYFPFASFTFPWYY
jgi:hypothetical protein